MTTGQRGLACREVRYSRHAFERMFQRGVSPDAIAGMVSQGEVIAEYPDDTPYPSMLVLGHFADRPIHAVIARDPQTGLCQVVTVYHPDPTLWDSDFKTRKKP